MAPLSLTPSELEDPLLPKVDRSEIVDRLAILRIQERTTYHIKDYITDSAPSRKKASKPVDADCRIKMCEWCYQVVDFCKFRRETVEIAMSYVDRYLCTPKGKSALVNRKEYQLVAMTALYVAIKLHEPMEMETSLLADLSRGCYEEMQFVEMEQTILQTIHWRVNGPTCVSFVGHFLALLPSAIHRSVAESIMEYARFQIELAIAEQAFVFLKPSHVALAAVMNAVEGMDPELFPHKTQSKFVRYIERYSELNVSSVEKIQGKLSMIMSKFLVEDWEEIEQQLAVQGDGNTEGDSKLRRSLKTSPVSVIGT